MRGAALTRCTIARQAAQAMAARGKRLDGRAADAWRPLEVECGVVGTADGSAQVFLGRTQAVAGVRFAVASPAPGRAGEGRLRIAAGPSQPAGGAFARSVPFPPQTALAHAVGRSLLAAIEPSALSISGARAVWEVRIELCTVNDDGNLADACSLAALAALRSATMRRCDDGAAVRDERGGPLALAATPVTCTVASLADRLVLDPSSEEEDASGARLSVTLLPDGTVVALRKEGFGSLTLEQVASAVELARRSAPALLSGVEGAVARFKKA